MDENEWLLLVPQVPSSPSSLRVFVWRRMRDAGAIGLQAGLWALPRSAENETAMRDLIQQVLSAGGHGLLLVAQPLDPSDQVELKQRFLSARDEEYAEVIDGCHNFLAEMEKETASQNFTFAELEENDEDLKKLVGWLRKIRTRDFFGGSQSDLAVSLLRQCHEAFGRFTREVYVREGLEPVDPEPSETPQAKTTDPRETGEDSHQT